MNRSRASFTVLLLAAVSTGFAGNSGARASTNSNPSIDSPPAATGPNGIYGTGGGVHDLHPIPLTSLQRGDLSKKTALRQAFLTQHPDGIDHQAIQAGGTVAPNYTSGNWFYADNYALNPEPDPKNSYGSGYGGNWIYNATRTAAYNNPNVHNPRTDWYNFYYDLCGPGSSTFVLHTWVPSTVDNYVNSTADGENLSSNGVFGWGNGWYGLLYEAAYREMTFIGSGSTVVWGTPWSQERTYLNSKQSRNTFSADPWDEGRSSMPESYFTFDINNDLQGSGGAVMAGVDSAGLPNWRGTHVDHFISVNGWNPSGYGSNTENNGTPYLNYADTADQSTPPTFGNFHMREHDFYANAIYSSATNPDGSHISEQLVIW